MFLAIFGLRPEPIPEVFPGRPRRLLHDPGAIAEHLFRHGSIIRREKQ
jgi:hypothetical protein